MWGLFPLYWAQLREVAAFETLAHRTSSSLLFLLILLLLWRKPISKVMAILATPRECLLLLVSALAITLNWGLYVWAVINNMVLEGSLGYFMTPIFSVFLGLLVFRETMTKAQTISVAIAAIGVLQFLFRVNTLPWVAIILGLSFAIYGMLRKLSKSNSLEGLFLELTMLSPLAVFYIAWLGIQQQGSFLAVDSGIDILLLLAGVVTAMPLLLFVSAAKRIKLTHLGMLTYLIPTIQFLLGYFYFAEGISPEKWLMFICIWISLLIFSQPYLGQRDGFSVRKLNPES